MICMQHFRSLFMPTVLATSLLATPTYSEFVGEGGPAGMGGISRGCEVKINSHKYMIGVSSNAELNSYVFIRCDPAASIYDKLCGIHIPQGGCLSEAAAALSKLLKEDISFHDLHDANRDIIGNNPEHVLPTMHAGKPLTYYVKAH